MFSLSATQCEELVDIYFTGEHFESIIFPNVKKDPVYEKKKIWKQELTRADRIGSMLS